MKNQTKPNAWPTGIGFGIVWFDTAFQSIKNYSSKKDKFILDKSCFNGVQYEKSIRIGKGARKDTEDGSACERTHRTVLCYNGFGRKAWQPVRGLPSHCSSC
jgi:hypothetical protein